MQFYHVFFRESGHHIQKGDAFSGVPKTTTCHDPAKEFSPESIIGFPILLLYKGREPMSHKVSGRLDISLFIHICLRIVNAYIYILAFEALPFSHLSDR